MPKFYATFPETAGQYAGRHVFNSKGERSLFLNRVVMRGGDVTHVTLSEDKTPAVRNARRRVSLDQSPRCPACRARLVSVPCACPGCGLGVPDESKHVKYKKDTEASKSREYGYGRQNFGDRLTQSRAVLGRDNVGIDLKLNIMETGVSPSEGQDHDYAD